MDIDRATLKRWTVAIVTEVEPSGAAVVEEHFDALADAGHVAHGHDESLAKAAESAPFAAALVPFLLTFVGGVGKDITGIGALIEKFLGGKADVDEATRLKAEIDATVAKSPFSHQQQDELRTGFEALFERLPPAA